MSILGIGSGEINWRSPFEGLNERVSTQTQLLVLAFTILGAAAVAGKFLHSRRVKRLELAKLEAAKKIQFEAATKKEHLKALERYLDTDAMFDAEGIKVRPRYFTFFYNHLNECIKQIKGEPSKASPQQTAVTCDKLKLLQPLFETGFYCWEIQRLPGSNSILTMPRKDLSPKRFPVTPIEEKQLMDLTLIYEQAHGVDLLLTQEQAKVLADGVALVNEWLDRANRQLDDL